MKDGNERLKHFDRIFNTETAKHIKFQDMKFLKTLYEYFEEDIYKPSTKKTAYLNNHKSNST